MPGKSAPPSSPPIKRKTLTLRVDPLTAKRLHAFALKQAKKLGRTPSYNECLVGLINDTSR